jgi:copper chaperone CopZ
MSYGVTPKGFNRKSLPIILEELQNEVIGQFGPNTIQTPTSPFGQLNGLMADIISDLWGTALSVYQSYDPDQAEGIRLDTLAKIRLLKRAVAENDFDFRQAITNQGVARVDIQDIERAIQNIEGVSFVKVFVNSTNAVDVYGFLPGVVCVSVLGGSDSELGTVVRDFIIPGIQTFGNINISSVIEGYCRTFTILRPQVINTVLNVSVKRSNDSAGCPPPSTLTIKNAIIKNLKLINGETITHFKVRSTVEGIFPNVEVTAISGVREGATLPVNPVPFSFIELPSISDVLVTLI